MGILDAIRSQFIEVIEWLDDSGNTILYRFPVHGQEIKNGARLTVRESQAAVFVFQGQIADVFGPGLYTIDGGNTPDSVQARRLETWLQFALQIRSLFRQHQTVHRSEMGNVESGDDARHGFWHGPFARFRNLLDSRCRSAAFIKEIAGTNAHFVTEDIEGQLKRTLVSGFSDALAESKIAALDLASNYDELGKFSRVKMAEDFKAFGLELTKFVIENVSLPAEVEAAMDKRTSMGVIGDVGRYAQFQAADAMRDAAQNTGGGGAATGAGLGAGFAIGNAMAGAMSNAMNQSNQPQAAAASSRRRCGSAKVNCAKCGTANLATAKFCSECGTKMETGPTPCAKCGAQMQAGSKFCNECGTKVSQAG